MQDNKKKNTPEEIFQFTGTRTQYELIVSALDMHSRLLAGQVETALYHPLVESNSEITEFTALRQALELLKKLSFPQFASNESDHNRGNNWAAFDIIQVIRNGLSWSKYPEGGRGVSFQEPMSFGKDKMPILLKYENGEAVRIRDQVNKTYFVRDELLEFFPKENFDIQDAVATLKKWKAAFDEQEAAMKETRELFGKEFYDKIMDSFKKPKGKKFRAPKTGDTSTVRITPEDLADPEKFFGKLLSDPVEEPKGT
mgnify:CR=1 FL=1